MKFRWEKKYLYWGLTAFLVIVCSISFFLLLNRFNEVMDALRFLGDLLMPFVLGLAIAYLLNPVMEFFERKCFLPLASRLQKRREARPAKPSRRPRQKTEPSRAPRALAITVTFLLSLALVCGLITMVLDQLIRSVQTMVVNMPAYLTTLENFLLRLAQDNPDLLQLVDAQFTSIASTMENWLKDNLLPQMTNLMRSVTTGGMGFVSTVMDLFVGLIVAIYVLFSKERFIAQMKKVVYAILPVRGGNTLLLIGRRADGMFGGFIKGKLIDSTIIGILCFLGLSLPFLQSPYTLLIAVIVGVSNIIPFFGPFIGAIPSALLLLMVDPWKCLWFIIFILVLQQVDGNVIGPRILGSSTGLSAFWVIFAIMVFGGFFGFVGMIIGVPAFGLIYYFLAELLKNRLERKKLPCTTEDYLDLKQIDPEGDEPPVLQRMERSVQEQEKKGT